MRRAQFKIPSELREQNKPKNQHFRGSSNPPDNKKR